MRTRLRRTKDKKKDKKDKKQERKKERKKDKKQEEGQEEGQRIRAKRFDPCAGFFWFCEASNRGGGPTGALP